MRFLAFIIVLMTVVGCQNTKSDANYNAYVQLVKDQAAAQRAEVTANQKRQDDQRNAIALLAQKCQDSTCVKDVATIMGFVAISDGKQGGTSAPLPVPVPYVKQPSIWATLGIEALRVVAPAAINGYVAIKQSDNSRRQTEAMYNFAGGVSNGAFDAAVAMHPNVTISGGYIGGDASGTGAGIGNSVSVSGNGSALGDGNTIDNSSVATNGNGNGVGTGNTVDNSPVNVNGNGNATGPGAHTVIGGDCPAGQGGATGNGGAGGAAAGGAPGGGDGGAGGSCSITPGG